LSKRLGEVLPLLGFDRVAELRFRRDTGGVAVASLAFPCCHDRRGFFAFSCNVGLRYEVLEGVLGADGADADAPTILVPLHLLEEDGHFLEWQFEREQDLAAVVRDVGARVRATALPWSEKYSDLASVRARLQSDRVADWFALDPERRVCMLAALDVVEGDRTAAIRRLEDALREHAGAHPKTRYQIEDVLRRILGSNP